jgi:GNAT superfamily N-acetyltransferase
MDARKSLQIVRAHPSDADALTQIAVAAKGHWGYPARWMERWLPILTVTAESIARNETYAACDTERIIGFSSLRVEGETIHLNDLFVLPSEMGNGVGRALFRHALARARELGFAFVEIQSDPNAAGFYERMGAERIGTQFSLLEGYRRDLPLLRCATAANVS